MKFLFSNSVHNSLPSLGLLAGRVGLGAYMLLGHGLDKLLEFGERSAKFPDPLGLGSPASLSGAIFAEFFCSALLVIGLATRAALLPLVFTMAVAAFMVHGNDPWFLSKIGGSKEPAMLYLIGYVILLCTGPGRFSLDERIGK